MQEGLYAHLQTDVLLCLPSGRQFGSAGVQHSGRSCTTLKTLLPQNICGSQRVCVSADKYRENCPKVTTKESLSHWIFYFSSVINKKPNACLQSAGLGPCNFSVSHPTGTRSTFDTMKFFFECLNISLKAFVSLIDQRSSRKSYYKWSPRGFMLNISI